MVPAGHYVDARFQDLTEGVGLDAGATRQVLAVGHHEINGVIGFNAGHAIMHGMAAGFADDVADEEDVHWESFQKAIGRQLMAVGKN
jgi:hypothetical protein